MLLFSAVVKELFYVCDIHPLLTVLPFLNCYKVNQVTLKLII